MSAPFKRPEVTLKDMLEGMYKPGTREQSIIMKICYRERDLFALVKDIFDELGMPGAVQQANVDVGDIQWATSDGEQYGFVVERKAVSDLAASLCDPRWREQNARMNNISLDKVVMYIIEGNILGPSRGAAPKSRLGAIVKKIARDGIRVGQVNSMDETAVLLVFMHFHLEHLKRDALAPKEYFYGRGITASSKKKDTRKEHRLECFLAQINGVSPEKGHAIAKVYPTVGSLLRAYMARPSSADVLLADILYKPDGTSKPRRIGPAVSKEIAEWFDIPEWTDFSGPSKKKRKVTSDSCLDDDSFLDDHSDYAPRKKNISK